MEFNDGNKPNPPQPDQKAEQILARVIASFPFQRIPKAEKKLQKPTPNSLPSAADAERVNTGMV